MNLNNLNSGIFESLPEAFRASNAADNIWENVPNNQAAGNPFLNAYHAASSTVGNAANNIWNSLPEYAKKTLVDAYQSASISADMWDNLPTKANIQKAFSEASIWDNLPSKGDIQKALSEVYGSASSTVGKAASSAADAIGSAASSAATSVWNSLPTKDAIQKALSDVYESASSTVGKAASGAADAIGSAASSAATSVWNSLPTKEKIMEGLKVGYDSASGAGQNAIDSISKMINNIMQGGRSGNDEFKLDIEKMIMDDLRPLHHAPVNNKMHYDYSANDFHHQEMQDLVSNILDHIDSPY